MKVLCAEYTFFLLRFLYESFRPLGYSHGVTQYALPAEHHVLSAKYFSLSFCRGVFISAAAAAALFCTECGQIFHFFRPRQTPNSSPVWSPEVENAVGEMRKAFAAPYRSDDDGQAYISASQHTSPVIVRVETWQATYSSLLNLCILCVLPLILHHLPSLLTFPTVLLLRS